METDVFFRVCFKRDLIENFGMFEGCVGGCVGGCVEGLFRDEFWF